MEPNDIDTRERRLRAPVWIAAIALAVTLAVTATLVGFMLFGGM
jgi:hypothetical protein